MLLKLKYFLQLIRWPNLLILVLTQLMLNYFVIGHVFKLIQLELPLGNFEIILVILSTVLMAAFGYVFNDLMDEEVDQVNKDEKRIIGKRITHQTGIWIGRVLLILAILPALVLSIRLQMIQLIFIHLIIAAGLWYYSVYLKKTILIGNLVISLFTGFSVFIVWLYHLVALRADPILLVDAQKISTFITQTVLIYSIFAFLLSMTREIIKDAEDLEGDQHGGMNTFIIRFGMQSTKLLSFIICILVLILLGLAIYISIHFHWYQLAIYLVVAVGIPLIYFMMNLRLAQIKKDFKDLSVLLKIIMIAGVLSMQLFYISYGT